MSDKARAIHDLAVAVVAEERLTDPIERAARVATAERAIFAWVDFQQAGGVTYLPDPAEAE